MALGIPTEANSKKKIITIAILKQKVYFYFFFAIPDKIQVFLITKITL